MMKPGRRARQAIRTVLAAAIVAALIYAIGQENLTAALAEIDYRWLVPLYGNAVLMIAGNAMVLRFLLRTAGHDPGLGRVLLAKSLGSFYSLVLPGDLFGGAAKWANLSAATGDRSAVLSSMLLAKLALAFPPLVGGSVALAVSDPFNDPAVVLAAALFAGIVTVVAVVVLNPASGQLLARLLESLVDRLPGRVRKAGRSLVASISEFQRLQLKDYAFVLMLSCGVFALSILGISFAAAAAGITVPISVYCWVSLILFMSRLLPLTIGNLGVREGIFVAAFGLYGVDAASALLAGLILFTSQILLAAVGAGYQAMLVGGQARWRPGGPQVTDDCAPDTDRQ